MKYLALTFLLYTILPVVHAQFNFFENMFGGHPQQQQQQRSGASQWVAYSDSVSCSQYLCPDTLHCVSRPMDCPCPDVEDVKCIVPDMEGAVEDATIVCTRGQNDCTKVEMLMRKDLQTFCSTQRPENVSPQKVMFTPPGTATAYKPCC